MNYLAIIFIYRKFEAFFLSFENEVSYKILLCFSRCYCDCIWV